MRLCHRTPPGDAILDEGFKDGHGYYGAFSDIQGVWLSDVPLDANDGAKGDDLLAVRSPKRSSPGTSGSRRASRIANGSSGLRSSAAARWRRCTPEEEADLIGEPDEAVLEVLRQRMAARGFFGAPGGNGTA